MAKIRRKINVQKQKSLTLKQSFHFCLKGIKFRLFRSSLTLLVIVMAVAFFMALLSENVILNSTAKGVEQEILAHRMASILLTHIYSIPTPYENASRLAKRHGDDSGLEEYSSVSALPRPFVNELAESARREAMYLEFFTEMSIGKKRILIGKNKDHQIFLHLADKENWQKFLDNLEPLRSLKLPTEEKDLREFLDNYVAYQKNLSAFSDSWKKRISELAKATREMTNEEKIEYWICRSSPDSLEEWRKLVTSYGFKLNSEDLGRIRSLLEKWKLRTDISVALKTAAKKELWKKAFLVNHNIDQKMAMLDDRRAVEILDSKYDRKQLAGVVTDIKLESDLVTMEQLISSKTEKKTGSILSGRQVFLLIISFIVCMVGIANAMLMAISERFREIATMKCLGATDRFILTQFLLEAFLQGIFGGIIGMFIGLIMSLVKNWLQMGGYVFTYFPSGEILTAGIISVVLGVGLSMLASIYPSWAASRMAPMDAMRVE